MHYFTQITYVRETKEGTDLIVHIPSETLAKKINKYSTGNKVDAEIRINDGRTITADQRKKIFATIKDIADHTGDNPEFLRKYLLYDYCSKSGEMPFSLSNCSISQAREYINHILDFVLEWNIPLTDLGIERTDDIDRYLYSCVKYRRCCITGQTGADIHHVDKVGMGRDRQRISHSNLRLIALSRKWHNKVHTEGEGKIFELYKIYGITVGVETLEELGLNYEDIT